MIVDLIVAAVSITLIVGVVIGNNWMLDRMMDRRIQREADRWAGLVKLRERSGTRDARWAEYEAQGLTIREIVQREAELVGCEHLIPDSWERL